MDLFGQTVSIWSGIFLLLALGMALSFEFVNGFHDTANAVATVIYTHSLKSTVAVIWSGCWNLIGVLTSSGAVAFGVLALLPVELVLNVGSGAGVGLANSWFAGVHGFGEGINWSKATEVGTSLLVSPIVGFGCSALLLLLCKVLIRRKELYTAPDKERTPPIWIRGLLVLTCTGVSFAHGSNDGQKGMGLIMLILVGILPLTFAVDLGTSQSAIADLASTTRAISFQMDRHSPGVAMGGYQIAADELSAYLKTTGRVNDRTFAAIGTKCREISEILSGKSQLSELTADQRPILRSDLYLTSEALGKLLKQKKLEDPAERTLVATLKSNMDKVTKFIPAWVKFAVALALGLGTMIGWKRIVVTVGERIGKEHLTYAQGASAELVAMATILAADRMGLPVSTTHVLSSGVAGTMAANRSGLQMVTLRNLLLAWVLTLPVCVLLGAGIFAFALNLLLRLGIK